MLRHDFGGEQTQVTWSSLSAEDKSQKSSLWGFWLDQEVCDSCPSWMQATRQVRGLQLRMTQSPPHKPVRDSSVTEKLELTIGSGMATISMGPKKFGLSFEQASGNLWRQIRI